MQQKNLLLFLALSALIVLAWVGVNRYLPQRPKEAEVAKKDETAKPDDKKPKGDDKKAEDKKAEDKKADDKKGGKKPDEKKGDRKSVDPLASDLQQFKPTK